MVNIKNVMLGEGRPKICVPIVAVTKKEILDEARVAAQSLTDIVEWRVDFYEDITNVEQVSATIREISEILSDKALLCTFRSKHEGGERELDSAAYTMMYKNIIDTGFADAIDIELFMGEEVAGELIAIAHKNDIKVIMSNHDFDKTPESHEIKKRLLKMEELGADVAKMAVMPNSKDDVLRLMSVTQEVKKEIKVPVVTMSMGKLGVVSRMAGELFGSDMTFATVTKASAPGQIEIDKLKEIIDIIHT